MRTASKFWIYFSVGFLVLCVVSKWFHPVVVSTVSISRGIYLLDKRQHEYRVGDTVCFNSVRPEWLHADIKIPPKHVSCKRVMGVAGDLVQALDNRVLVESVDTKVVNVFIRTPHLNGVPVGFNSSDGVIPKGFAFLASEYPGGWDSRYLGLIPVEDIVGKAYPVLLWD